MSLRLLVLISFACLSFYSCSKDNSTNPTTNDPVITSVTIGTQIWTNKNLDVVCYQNGDTIPQVTDANQWSKLKTGAWCYYNNDPANSKYGKIYNWYAVHDSRGLAPKGWKIPSDADWKILEASLGMVSTDLDMENWRGNQEGGKLKDSTTKDWQSPNKAAINSSGFTALPAGYRADDGSFNLIKQETRYWTGTENDASFSWYRALSFNYTGICRTFNYKTFGFSIRCIKN